MAVSLDNNHNNNKKLVIHYVFLKVNQILNIVIQIYFGKKRNKNIFSSEKKKEKH